MRRTRSSRTSVSGRLLAIAALLILAGAPALARQSSGSGYQSDYDYAGQGDDWYGSGNRPNPKRDFAPPLLDQILSGEDFCVGYEKTFDPWALGAPLFRTSSREFDYSFRFSAASKTWPCIVGFPAPTCDDGNPCTYDYFDEGVARCAHEPERDGLSCTDGLFCNGDEACLAGTCLPGIPPSCDDANSCTVDVCEATSDQCVSIPFSPPGEVLALTLTPDDPRGRFVTLSWDPVHGADVYDLYRSASGLHTELQCFQRDLSGTSTSDLGEPPSDGGVFLFLPVSVNCAGGGTLGYSSAGQERIAWRSCR